MTPKEIQTELEAIRRDVGPSAYISLSITTHDEKPVYIGLYPYGMTKNEGYLHVCGTFFADTINDLRDKWAEYRASFAKTITRKMALAIIRLTDEFGECSDAALRNEFDAGQVAAYGTDACELANTMAAKGPFVITALAGANAA